MSERLEGLRKAYGFDAWRAAPAAGEQIFVWRFRLPGDALDGDWRAARMQYVEVPGAPPANLSIWRRESGDDRRLVSLDVYETASRAAAREYLLHLLGEFQGPALERRDGPGDVAFGKGDAAVLFARGNVVVFARSVERTPVPLTALAGKFDGYLTSRPDPTGEGPIVRARTTPSRPGEPVRLTVEWPGQKGHVWYKMFSSTGELRLEGEQLVYVATASGDHEVVVAGFEQDGRGTARRVKLA